MVKNLLAGMLTIKTNGQVLINTDINMFPLNQIIANLIHPLHNIAGHRQLPVTPTSPLLTRLTPLLLATLVSPQLTRPTSLHLAIL